MGDYALMLSNITYMKLYPSSMVKIEPYSMSTRLFFNENFNEIFSHFAVWEEME